MSNLRGAQRFVKKRSYRESKMLSSVEGDNVVNSCPDQGCMAGDDRMDLRQDRVNWKETTRRHRVSDYRC